MQDISVLLLSLLLLDGGLALDVPRVVQESSVYVEGGLRYEVPQDAVGGGGGRARPLPAPV